MSIFRPRPSQHADDDLLAMLSGNSQMRGVAIKELFGTSYRKVTAYLRKHGGDEESAKEILQQVLVKLVEKARDGKLDAVNSLEAYLISACKNQWMNLQRRAGKEVAIPENFSESQVDGNAGPYRLLEQQDLKNAVRDLLGQLGEKCRDLLIWSLGEGLDMKSIAVELGYKTAQTAMNSKSRCKQKLKELVQQQPGYQQLIRQIILPD